jgi:transcriptional regulator with XRE-family HTH domain
MRRRQLGAELQRRRVEADASRARAAEVLDCSEARIRHIENGRNSLSRPDLAALGVLYNIPADVLETLEEIRQEASRRGWWATYRLPPWLQAYVGLEADAISIRVFELELITALLQTRDYAYRTHELAEVDPDDIDRLTDARIRRQSTLDGATLSVVMSESAVLRVANEPRIGAGQIRHLIKMATHPNVTIRILPLTAGLHPSGSGSFHLMEFPEGVSNPAAYQEYAVGGHLVDDSEAVSRLSTLFERLEGMTLSASDSVAMLERLAREAEDGREEVEGQ